MTRVFNDKSIKGNEKLLMLALADNANDTGVCFPSWNSLMSKTSMSRGSVSKWINVLVEKGLVYKKNRSRKNGGRSSNKYLLYPSINYQILDEEDAIIFEEIHSQSSEVELGGLSSEVELGEDSQSSEVELECEPSLKALTITIKKTNKKRNPFDAFLKSIESLFEKNKILTHASKINGGDKTKKYFKLIDADKLTVVSNNYMQYVSRNKGKAVRLDKYLLALHEGNLDAIEYGIENLKQKSNLDVAGKDYGEDGDF